MCSITCYVINFFIESWILFKSQKENRNGKNEEEEKKKKSLKMLLSTHQHRNESTRDHLEVLWTYLRREQIKSDSIL